METSGPGLHREREIGRQQKEYYEVESPGSCGHGGRTGRNEEQRAACGVSSACAGLCRESSEGDSFDREELETAALNHVVWCVKRPSALVKQRRGRMMQNGGLLMYKSWNMQWLNWIGGGGNWSVSCVHFVCYNASKTNATFDQDVEYGSRCGCFRARGNGRLGVRFRTG